MNLDEPAISDDYILLPTYAVFSILFLFYKHRDLSHLLMKENQSMDEIQKIISQDRVRTNILKVPEQKAIAYMVQKIPHWISSDMLTGIGFAGSILIFNSFVMAKYIDKVYLLWGILGYVVCWFGDSLDGRMAYYRNKQRKWYGFTLDLTIDWIGMVLMGWGFIIYADGPWEILGFLFVVMYGWEILTTLLRYKLTDKYSIDSGLLGPTEVRILICFILMLEVLVAGSINFSGLIACLLLFIFNIINTVSLIKLADNLDFKERNS
jgi:hypothetical protein